ncbi:peptidylprolyl isomerase [Candidatus Woesearchaeota archaeon]|jgi:cyclophilin family peptidyl-prolyl cis-trans isomerase|nr:peptidylprolyl isomerase [Candidatus Woesearchaeota archaeon]MBT3438624.1 peptidylprolyl isomerase [Candidatus Woesearchaeota archaeon]MBT4058478.1 peptidylprolyl isomerase [Candidatus Woesearchaeota archaeon]MBT4207309.1 peptidylprolyl isomerase [Candidatus Woesearchaeota archaeon]MBT4730966.1 peptidylprolyl isomerase [Candidatus Woesearchaeota archaeon]
MKKMMALLLIMVFVGGCKMDNTKIKMETTAGDMEFELFDELVPETAGNFKKLVEEGFYDGQRFHRIIKDFMVQGGDPLSKDVANMARWGTGGPDYSIKDEFVDELKHDTKGLLSMANSGPNTGGSQFFITLVPTPWLDGKHAIFGKITSGENVLAALGAVETGESDRPVEEIIVTKVSVI